MFIVVRYIASRGLLNLNITWNGYTWSYDYINHLQNKCIQSVAGILQQQFGLALVPSENMTRENIYATHRWSSSGDQFFFKCFQNFFCVNVIKAMQWCYFLLVLPHWFNPFKTNWWYLNSQDKWITILCIKAYSLAVSRCVVNISFLKSIRIQVS